jgi:hypothetical protein
LSPGRAAGRRGERDGVQAQRARPDREEVAAIGPHRPGPGGVELAGLEQRRPGAAGARGQHAVAGVEDLVLDARGDRRRAPRPDLLADQRGLRVEVLVEPQVQGVPDAQVDEGAGAGEHDQHCHRKTGDQAYAQRQPPQSGPHLSRRPPRAGSRPRAAS